MMNNQDVENHIVSYPDVKEPQKQHVEKHSSPRKSNVLCFNPDGSLCIPADLKDKLVQKPVKSNPSKLCLSRNRPSRQDGGENAPDENTTDNHSPGSKENVTPYHNRKRKKNSIPQYKPPEGSCNFCYSTEESKELGEMKTFEEIRAHYHCMLFSSGLCQAGKNEEGMWGFLLPDIKKELNRGKRLRCTFCKLPGALIGCHKARCAYTYHLTCGLSNHCLMQFYDSFRSFCSSHRPLQYFLKEQLGQTLDCPICCDDILVESKVVPQNILVTECCNVTPVHRVCIQNQADASGYFFRCPMCNNEKKYISIMKIMGINIPQSDAMWEKDGYYDELLEEYWRCDVPICLNPDGRKSDSMQRDKWDLMKCSTCGQCGAHPACLGYEKRGPKDWHCRGCLEIMAKVEKENLEKAAKEKAASDGRTENAPLSNVVPSEEVPCSSSQLPDLEISKVVTPVKKGRNCRKMVRKPLSPSKDPFLMTPDILKEAVFKFCVNKLKKTKIVSKNVNPDNWTTGYPVISIIEDEEEEEEEEEEEISEVLIEKPELKAHKFEIMLKREYYVPPPTIPIHAISDDDESDDYESEDEVIDTRKEEQWQLVLKNKELAIKASAASKNQKTLNQFFKPKSAKSDMKEEIKSPETKKRRMTG